MARKYSIESSDDGLSELDDFINKHVKHLPARNAPKLNPPSRMPILLSPTRPTTKRPLKTLSPRKEVRSREIVPEHEKVFRAPLIERGAHLRPKAAISKPAPDLDFNTAAKPRATPHRRAKNIRNYSAVVDVTFESDEEIYKSEESVYQTCDSDVESEKELPQGNAFLRLKELQPSHNAPTTVFEDLRRRDYTPNTDLSASDSDDLDSNIFRSRSPRKGLKTYKSPTKTSHSILFDQTLSSDKENDGCGAATIQPTKENGLPFTVDRPSTPPPPASPSKSKLVSPSKKKARIPTPPHRPSIDAFWNVHAVNDWNDQYSPEKPVVSPKKNRFLLREDVSDSPLSSPRKIESPIKANRVLVNAKKAFADRKHQICEEFFAELDNEVTNGKVSQLAASAGGVQFVWSKTLNSTAGRANWRKEKKKTKGLDGTIETTIIHHASIELAEKVIDDEERLLNVVAHEFCHLANFMVSEIKDQPHGRQFKAWGAKCTKLFGHRGVEVTTKHSYQIDYKYIWSCTNELCGQEFKRHSKSIDPARHSCGTCRDKLVQVKPVPRKQGGKAGLGGYAAFVKENFAAIKKDMAGAPHKEVMAAVGQRYREQKAAAEKEAGQVAPPIDVDDMARALEVITLD